VATLSILPERHLPFPAEEREAAGADLEAMLVGLVISP
jgi:hypothetical protein